MGAEIGATTSMFPYNKRMYDYLVATGREPAAKLADAFRENLRPDEGAEYDEVWSLGYSRILLLESKNLKCVPCRSWWRST